MYLIEMGENKKSLIIHLIWFDEKGGMVWRREGKLWTIKIRK